MFNSLENSIPLPFSPAQHYLVQVLAVIMCLSICHKLVYYWYA